MTLGCAAAVGAAMRGHARATSPAQKARARIAAHSDFHWNMSVAAGGRHVAYANGYGEPGLFVASLDGALPVIERIPADVAMPRDPALSPDGRMVAFQSFGDEDSLQTLHLHDRRTGRTEKVVDRDARGSLVNDPAWSRDGRFLAYTRSWPDARGVWRTELHVIAVADRGDRRLLEGPARAPAWSPDGARLAFLSGPDLMVTDPHGSEVAPLARFGSARPAPSLASPDPPAWSPDGTTIAHAVEEDRCHRIYLVDLSGRRRLLADECAMRPVWFPSGDRIAYLRLSGSSRTLWSRSTDGGEARRLGFADGMVYDHGFDADGAVILLGMPGDHPRALWRAAPGGGAPSLLVSSMRPALAPRWVSRPVSTEVASTGGVRVPLQIFPRLCGEARGPALIWLHGGPREDVAPRWYQEIQYAAAMGMTVVAVNYRGSTGNGKAYRELEGDRVGQLADVVAALEHVRSRADVDPEQVYLFLISWAAALGYPVVREHPEAFAGVVDWLGSPGAIDDLVERPGLPRLPPMLWVSGTRDPITEHRRTLAARARRAGAEIEEVEIDADHAVLPGEARAAALGRLEAFLRRRSSGPARCDEATE
jgi:dipeptidyl aminopeptidase/acylaminoacyl peptidase